MFLTSPQAENINSELNKLDMLKKKKEAEEARLLSEQNKGMIPAVDEEDPDLIEARRLVEKDKEENRLGNLANILPSKQGMLNKNFLKNKAIPDDKRYLDEFSAQSKYGATKHDVMIAQAGGAQLGSITQRVFGNSGYITPEGQFVKDPVNADPDSSLHNAIKTLGYNNVLADLSVNNAPKGVLKYVQSMQKEESKTLKIFNSFKEAGLNDDDAAAMLRMGNRKPANYEEKVIYNRYEKLKEKNKSDKKLESYTENKIQSRMREIALNPESSFDIVNESHRNGNPLPGFEGVTNEREYRNRLRERATREIEGTEKMLFPEKYKSKEQTYLDLKPELKLQKQQDITQLKPEDVDVGDFIGGFVVVGFKNGEPQMARIGSESYKKFMAVRDKFIKRG